MNLILESNQDSIASIALNDPLKRNALSLAMFEALDAALQRIAQNDSINIVVLRGEGPAFCAGFDLAACMKDPEILPELILRLSTLNRSLRRLPQVVIACVHSAAIAGGCAILSGCDFVIAAPDAQLGYPVHAIGISPAVTIPTLRLALGDGPARALLMSGEMIDGTEAHRRGLVTHLARSSATLADETQALAASLARKGPHALRTTKAWLNELDGSLHDAAFDASARDSAQAARQSESRDMLARFWSTRRA
jgi:enoyl-CoA hydratase/carnithine racemase